MTSYRVTINGKSLEAKVLAKDKSSIKYEIAGKVYSVSLEPKIERVSTTPTVNSVSSHQPRPTLIVSIDQIVAPMSGLVSKVLIKKGEKIKAGQTILVMEAMKMENNIVSPRDGSVKTVHVSPSQEVNSQQVLVTLD